MSANFNLRFVENLDGSGVNGVQFIDPKGNRVMLADSQYAIIFLQFEIAPFWKKQTYEAKSLVWYGGGLYYNPNAINTAENWVAGHWTKTTLANYIKIMTT